MFALDALDTLWVMGLDAATNEAADIVRQRFSVDRRSDSVAVGTVITRVVGGLLAAYQATGDTSFLLQAESVSGR